MRGARAFGVVLALAACGRLGFQERDDDDAIELVVTSDEYQAEQAGMPIRDATVLIDRGNGILERATTDDTGTARFASSGVVAYHVVYRSSEGWRVYTAERPRAGTFELGGRPAYEVSRSMSVTVPAGNGVGPFILRVPERCALTEMSSTPTITFAFRRICDGLSVRTFVFRPVATGSGHDYVDADTMTLADGSTHTVTGTYQAVPAVAIEVSKLPSGPIKVNADILSRTGVDLTMLTPTRTLDVAPQGNAATVMSSAPPGGDAVRVFVTAADLLPPYASSVVHIKPATIGSAVTLDASTLLPPFTSLTVDRLPSLSWTGGGGAGSWIAVEATTSLLKWNAYVEPSATTATFPALPSDLGVPTPAAFDIVVVTKLDVPGVAFETLARTFDRTWMEWPHDASLLPADGGSMAVIRYFASAKATSEAPTLPMSLRPRSAPRAAE